MDPLNTENIGVSKKSFSIGLWGAGKELSNFVISVLRSIPKDTLYSVFYKVHLRPEKLSMTFLQSENQ